MLPRGILFVNINHWSYSLGSHSLHERSGRRTKKGFLAGVWQATGAGSYDACGVIFFRQNLDAEESLEYHVMSSIENKSTLCGSRAHTVAARPPLLPSGSHLPSRLSFRTLVISPSLSSPLLFIVPNLLLLLCSLNVPSSSLIVKCKFCRQFVLSTQCVCVCVCLCCCSLSRCVRCKRVAHLQA